VINIIFSVIYSLFIPRGQHVVIFLQKLYWSFQHGEPVKS